MHRASLTYYSGTIKGSGREASDRQFTKSGQVTTFETKSRIKGRVKMTAEKNFDRILRNGRGERTQLYQEGKGYFGHTGLVPGL
jgi:hypothetical protein